MGLRAPNLLRPMNWDPGVVSVTLFVSEITTDVDGNEIRDDNTQKVFKGWDVQPIQSGVPSMLTREGMEYVLEMSRVFAPIDAWDYLKDRPEGMQFVTASGESYRITSAQNWGTHLVIYAKRSS